MWGASFLKDVRDLTLSCFACTDEKIENPKRYDAHPSLFNYTRVALYRFPDELFIRSE